MFQSSFKTKIKFIAVSFFLFILTLVSYIIYINIDLFSIANVLNFYLEIGHEVSENYLAYYLFFFLIYLFKNFIEKKFKKSLKIMNAGIAKDGLYYLFFVRMTPIFPFFLINLIFSVTKIKALQFYIISQIGMFLGTLLFINAGTQISKINSIEDILNKYVIISLVLIALMPMLIKKIFFYYRS